MKLVSAALRAGWHCACLMLDVDHFQRVNDTFGQQAGDQVLAHLGRLLARADAALYAAKAAGRNRVVEEGAVTSVA